MIDPLTAISVAGNVLQFAELGTKLLLKACEIYKSADGLDDEYRDLGKIAENVRNCNTVLEQFALTLPPAQKSSAHNLLEANNICLKISTEFLQLLDKAAPKSLDHKISAAFKSAFTNIWNQKKIARLDKEIIHARSNLSIILLTFLTSETTNMQNGMLQNIGESRSEILQRMQDVSDNLRGDVRDLIESFSAMELNVQNQLTAFRQPDCSLTKETKHSKLEVSLRTESPELMKIRQKIHKLDLTTRKAQAKIMDSLFFPQMHSRRDQIVEAHPQTLKWVFERKRDTQIAWHEFAGWLEAYDSQRIYWVRGKAGSGKSTLLRALDGQIKFNSFKGWAQGFPLIQVSTYFWHAGSHSQRSVAGLLRSLLHGALELVPGILPDVISASRWNSALVMGSQMNDWTIQELRDTLTKFIRLTSEPSEAPSRVLFFVDGLDEYEGSDEERQRMIDLFAEITQSPHVKVCLSSRPWVVYVQSLQQYPSLRLESLTKGDIKLFVHDRLFSDKLFREMLHRKPLLRHELSEDIVQKAQGVFLWVRLVVRDLLQVVRDGGSASLVRKTLREMPSELNVYFTRMLDSIDLRYRKDSSMIIQFALCNLLQFTDVSRLPLPKSRLVNERLEAPPAPLLLHLHYLEEESPPAFALSDEFNPLDLGDVEEVGYELKILERRLTSRSMELLEAVPWRASLDKCSPSMLSSITFFHRTAKDFLCTLEAQQILHRYTDGPYDAYTFRCNALLSDIAGQRQLPDSHSRRISLATHLLVQLRGGHFGEYEAWRMLEIMVTHLDPTDPKWQTLGMRKGQADRVISLQKTLLQVLRQWREYESTILTLAIQFGLDWLVKPNLTEEVIRAKKGRPILDYALRPSFEECFPWDPAVSVVENILSLGADPHQQFQGSSVLSRAICYTASLRDRPPSLVDKFYLLINNCSSPLLCVGDIRRAWHGLEGEMFDRLSQPFTTFQAFVNNLQLFRSEGAIQTGEVGSYSITEYLIAFDRTIRPKSTVGDLEHLRQAEQDVLRRGSASLEAAIPARRVICPNISQNRRQNLTLSDGLQQMNHHDHQQRRMASKRSYQEADDDESPVFRRETKAVHNESHMDSLYKHEDRIDAGRLWGQRRRRLSETRREAWETELRQRRREDSPRPPERYFPL